ncbi:MAG: PAS domain S-box protein, partial [Nitrospirae bacterium]|nr:PAS domain S-box protein [Nitrospirota bacterium]
MEKQTSKFKTELEQYGQYGDLTELNKRRDLLDTVGKETLERIAKSYLDLLETCAVIYEADGSYATAFFSSGYCKFMHNASRELCNTADNAVALASGKWRCHESCWTNASRITIETGEPYDLRPCGCGINLYAVPIKASGTVVGTISYGYGSPPKEALSDDKTIGELAEKYKVGQKSLLEIAKEYKERPEYVIEALRGQLLLSAVLIGDIYERNKLSAKLAETEERLNTAFEFSTLGIAITLPESKGWLRVNDEFCRIMGYPREELMRMTWVEITHPDDVEATATQINRVLAGEINGFSLDKRYIRKDGTVIYATLWVNCKRCKSGNADYFVTMIQDRTGRKKMEEALRVEIASRRAAENKLNRLLEASFEGISIIEEGRIVDANKRFAEMFGYAPGEIFGMSVFNLVTPQSRETVMEHISEEYDKPYELDCMKKDGTVIRVEICGKNVEYEGRRIRMSALRDITERKTLEKRLEAINKHLETRVKDEIEKRMQKEKLLIQQSKMAAMGEMIAAIAHQWKQPLNSLGLLIQDILDAYQFGELDDAYLNTAVEKSMSEVQFMASTIDDFKSFFKPSIEKETC